MGWLEGGAVARFIREAGELVPDRPGAMRAFYADAEAGRLAVAADVAAGWDVDEDGAGAAALLLAYFAGWKRGAGAPSGGVDVA